MSLLKGKVVAVAGAAGNVGSAIVSAFLKEGATVYAISRDEQRLQQLKSEGGKLVLWPVMTLNEQLFKDIEQREGRIDAAVSSLGIFVENTRLATLAESDWQAFIESNLTSHFHFCSGFIRHMQNEKEGALLMVNGESSLKPRPGSGVVSIMDAAQAMMMRVFAAEEKHLRISELMITDWVSPTGIVPERVGDSAVAMLMKAPSGAIGRLTPDGFSIQE